MNLNTMPLSELQTVLTALEQYIENSQEAIDCEELDESEIQSVERARTLADRCTESLVTRLTV